MASAQRWQGAQTNELHTIVRYTYAYKTSDGTRHEAAIEAKCREDVFAELRKRGVKPIKVVAADGSKANGEVHGVRKCVVAAIAVAAAVVVGVVAFWAGDRGGGFGETALPETAPRHQIYGDPVLVEAFERGDFGKALTNRVDRMLAWFAQPGKLMCPRGTDPRRMGEEFAKAVEGRDTPATGKMPVAPGHGAAPTTGKMPVVPETRRAK